MDAIPHAAMWADLPSLVWDGVRFTGRPLGIGSGGLSVRSTGIGKTSSKRSGSTHARSKKESKDGTDKSGGNQSKSSKGRVKKDAKSSRRKSEAVVAVDKVRAKLHAKYDK